MIQWLSVVVAVLWYCSPGVCDDVSKDHTTPQLLPNNSNLLSGLIKGFVKSQSGNCSANLVSGGFLTLKNKSWPNAQNYTINTPNLFVTCEGYTGNVTDYSELLRNFSETLASLKVVDDSKTYLKKDDFKDSILMIAFSSCAICVGTWMLYMVLLFQKCPQHTGRRLLVLFYVLFAGIYESVNLSLTVQKIFKKQYNGNYQDSMEYELVIINSNAHRAGELVTDVLACLNWISIIYYMFHDCKIINKRWLPRAVANRNRLIVGGGLCLTIVEECLYGVLLWSNWNNGVRIAHVVVELLTYALFCGLTCYFVYHDFGFTLSLKKRPEDRKSKARRAWKKLWRDYHEILPVLICNLTLFALLFLARIYLSVCIVPTKKWKFNVIKFSKITITVSVWGLITVLEKRELIVSRETVLGRKIQNADRFFYDPSLSKDDAASYDAFSGSSITLEPSETSGSGCKTEETKKSPWAPLKFSLPAKAWKSQLASAQRRKKDIKKRRKRILHALAGSNKCRKEDERRPEDPRSAVSNEEHHMDQDNASIETELATNYLYDIYDQ